MTSPWIPLNIWQQICVRAAWRSYFQPFHQLSRCSLRAWLLDSSQLDIIWSNPLHVENPRLPLGTHNVGERLWWGPSRCVVTATFLILHGFYFTYMPFSRFEEMIYSVSDPAAWIQSTSSAHVCALPISQFFVCTTRNGRCSTFTAVIQHCSCEYACSYTRHIFRTE